MAMNSASQIQSIEISLESLIKSCNRRRKWKTLFDRCGEEDQQEQTSSSWRAHLLNFLDSTVLRIFTIFLLLVDLILSSLELSFSTLSPCPEKKKTTSTTEEVWFHWVGIAILSLLCSKNLALLLGLGPRTFLRGPGYVLDGVVMAVALFMESFLEGKGGGLVVVVSLWRIVRVVESAFELSDEAIEAKIKLIILQFQNLQAENTRLLEIIAEKDLIIDKLQEELDTRKFG